MSDPDTFHAQTACRFQRINAMPDIPKHMILQRAYGARTTATLNQAFYNLTKLNPVTITPKKRTMTLDEFEARCSQLAKRTDHVSLDFSDLHNTYFFGHARTDSKIFLIKNVEKFSNVSSLDLSNNNLQQPEFDALAHILPGLNCLAHLNLSFNSFRQEHDMSKLADALPKCAALKEVILSESFNFTVDDGVFEMLFAALHSCSQLSLLDLSHNSRSIDGDNDVFMMPCFYDAFLTAPCKIQTLNFGYDYMDNNDVNFIVLLLEANVFPSLTNLNLSNNNIETDGANKLFQALGSCPFISKLDLTSNPLDLSTQNFMQYFENGTFQNLTKLSLADTEIGVYFTKYLNVDTAPNLEFLNLSGGQNNFTYIETSDADSIVTMLENCPSLTKLSLNNCAIDKSAAKTLAEGLHAGNIRGLKELNLIRATPRWTCFDFMCLFSAWRHTECLKTIRFAESDLGDEEAALRIVCEDAVNTGLRPYGKKLEIYDDDDDDFWSHVYEEL